MKTRHCAVCRVEVAPDAPRIGDRYYCDRHYRKLMVDRKGIWISSFAGILATGIFVALSFALQYVLPQDLPDYARIATGLAIVTVPVGLWLFVFWKLDSIEPEPKGKVLEIALLGAILASGIGYPLVNQAFRLPEWIYSSTNVAERILGYILIAGFSAEWLKYAAVRFTLFTTPTFDERTDGVVYCAAAGLGYAFMINLIRVSSAPVADWGIASAHVAVDVLGHASFAGISGYFLGATKFSDKPVWWMPTGIVIASSADGLMQILLSEVSRNGINYDPIVPLILAASFSLSVFALLFVLVRRLTLPPKPKKSEAAA